MQENTPHISANKLGEFKFASEAKKRSILRTIKYPTPFKNGRYPEPQSAFVNFMTDANHDVSIFEQKKDQLRIKSAVTKYAKDNKVNCLDAIDKIVSCINELFVGQLRYVGQKKMPKEEYNKGVKNVTLHLKPTVLLIDKKTGAVKGFIKLAFTKSRAIDYLEAQTILSAIKSHVEDIHKTILPSANCILFDVFHQRKFNAPKYSQVTKTQLQMLCAEIAELWPTITKNAKN